MLLRAVSINGHAARRALLLASLMVVAAIERAAVGRAFGATHTARAPAASAPAIQVASAPVVQIHRPLHPVLIRNPVGALLRITIDASATGPQRLLSLELSMKGTSSLADLADLRLFAADGDGQFAADQPLSSPLPPAETLVLPLDLPLAEGPTVFWVACRLSDSAEQMHAVRVSCLKVSTTAGDVRPEDDPACFSQRIGFALRRAGEDGVHTWRIPAITRSARGTLLAVYDMRRRAGRDLQEDIDIGLSRSTDGGQSWDAPRVIMDQGQFGGLPEELNGCSDPGIVVDQQTGEIFCFAVWMHGKSGRHQWVEDGSEPGFEIGRAAQLLLVSSTDDGLTWSAPQNLTRQLKPEALWLLAPAPQSGLCLADGTLVMPMEARSGRGTLETFATIMVSRDHGRSWNLGNPGVVSGNECQAARLSDGSIMLNVRNDLERFRAVAVTRDLGQTWQPHPSSGRALIEPNCNGSLVRVDFRDQDVDRHVLLFANPHSRTSRTMHTVQVSFDEGLTWPESHHWLLDAGRGAGYASLVQIDNDHVGIVYEGSQAHLVFEKLPLRSLLEPARREAVEDLRESQPSAEGLQFLQQRRQSPPFGAAGFDLQALRAGMNARKEPAQPGITLQTVPVAGVDGEWVLAADADPDLRLLYLHGGGWVSGSAGNYLPLAAEISRVAGCAVLALNYRLAPEHPFPAGLNDCVEAHRWLVEHGPAGPSPARATFIAGDSAGGNLTLAALLALRDRRLPLPAAAVAISPATDFTLSSPSLSQVADPIISARTMPEFRERYLQGGDPQQPLASPVFGDFSGLPPLLIQTGAEEMLRDDSIRVARKARRDGVPVRLEIWPGMVHVFQIRGLPESREAVRRIAEFFRRYSMPAGR
ncbi:MAG: alpha/beta hydrolase fold domain-containing protein [Planctomycetota bacterium]